MPEQKYNLKPNERVYDTIRGRKAKFEDNPDELRTNPDELSTLGKMLLEETKLTPIGRMLLGKDGLGE